MLEKTFTESIIVIGICAIMSIIFKFLEKMQDKKLNVELLQLEIVSLKICCEFWKEQTRLADQNYFSSLEDRFKFTGLSDNKENLKKIYIKVIKSIPMSVEKYRDYINGN